MSEAPLYGSAAPVVKTGGALQPDVGRDLLRVEVDEGTEGLRRLVLHVVASATRQPSSGDVVEYLDGSVFDFGRSIEVSIGPAGNEKIIFKGTISALEVGFEQGDVPHVTVLAEDELMALRMTQTSATYTQVSDADVARAVASRHSLTPDVQLTARPTTWCSSSTRATSTSSARGPGCSRPRCGPGMARCTSARGRTGRAARSPSPRGTS